MKKTIAILALAAVGITTVNAGIRFGINVGIAAPAPVVVTPAPVVVAPAPVVVTPAPVVVTPPMPAPVVEVVPACPVAGYVWVGGSWGWCDNHWAWTRGHWGPRAHWDHHHEGFHGGFHGEHGRR